MPGKGNAAPALEDMRVHAGDAARLLKSLAHESRLMVLCALADGEHTVGQLNEMVPLSQSALSQHLARLREEGLVATRREGQQVYYRLAASEVSRVISTLQEIFCPS